MNRRRFLSLLPATLIVFPALPKPARRMVNVGVTDSLSLRFIIEGLVADWREAEARNAVLFKYTKNGHPESTLTFAQRTLWLQHTRADVTDPASQIAYAMATLGLSEAEVLAPPRHWQLWINPEQNAWGLMVFRPSAIHNPDEFPEYFTR